MCVGSVQAQPEDWACLTQQFRLNEGELPPIPVTVTDEYKKLVEACLHRDYRERPAFVDIEKRLRAMGGELRGALGVLGKGGCLRLVLGGEIRSSPAFEFTAQAARSGDIVFDVWQCDWPSVLWSNDGVRYSSAHVCAAYQSTRQWFRPCILLCVCVF